MRKTFLCGLILFIAVAMLTGCATRGDFTAISSKNVNLSNLKLDPKKMKGRASGEDCQTIVLFIPTGGPPHLKEALDQALESKKSSVLANAVVRYYGFYVPLLFGQTCWIVEGDAYDTYE